VEDIAYSTPSEGSYTTGKERDVQSGDDGRLTVTVDLKETKLVNRFEFTIDNPNYLRGQSRPFELQTRDAGGRWNTAYRGRIYGTICGKAIAPVNTNAVRLIVKTQNIKQFDIFDN
jgi:hypothetical protein